MMMMMDNETHKILWDFEIPNLRRNNQQNKRICRIMDFAVPANHRVKLKENEKKDEYHNLARTMEQESDGDTNYNWCS